VNPLLRATIPFGPEIALVRKMLGFKYRDVEILAPFSRGVGGIIGSGVDLLRGGAKASELAPDLRLSTLERAMGMFDAAQLTTRELRNTSQFIKVMLGDSSEQAVSVLGLADEMPEDLFRVAAKKKLIRTGDVMEARAAVLGDTLTRREEEIAGRLKERNAEFEAFLADSKVRGATAGIDTGTVDQEIASYRAVWSMFSPGKMANDSFGWGHALMAREKFGTLMANTLVFGMRDRLRTMAKSGPERAALAELFGRLIDTKGAFVRKGDRIFRNPGGAAAGRGALLDDLLVRHPELRELLDNVGIPAEFQELTDVADDLLVALGRRNVQEGVTGGFIEDYLTRSFQFENKLFKGKNSARQIARDYLDDEKGVFADVHRLSKQKGGKLSFAEMRTATDEAMLLMEKQGLGRMKRDALELIGNYVDATSRAMVGNMLLRTFPMMSPTATTEMFERYGVKLSQDVLNKHGLNAIVLPQAMEALEKAHPAVYRQAIRAYTPFEMSKRFRWPTPLQRTEQELIQTLRSGKLVGVEARAAREELANVVASDTDAGLKARQRLFDPKTGVLRKKGGFVFTLEEMGEVVRSGALPRSAVQSGAVRDRIRREVGRRVGIGRNKLREQEKILAAKVEGSKPQDPKLFVHKDLEPIVADVFQTFGDESRFTSTLKNKLDELNRKTKAVALAMDIFHYNVMTYVQMSMNPLAFAKSFGQGGREAIGRVASRAALGGAIGGGLGAASGDERTALAGGLAGALYASSIHVAGRNALNMRRKMLNPKHAETLAWMGIGGVSMKPNDRSIGLLTQTLEGWATDLRRKGGRNLLIHPIEGVAHVVDAFDRRMWEYLQLGSKQLYFDTVFSREVAKLPKTLSQEEMFLRKSQIAREVGQIANMSLGGQVYSTLLAHPKYQKDMRTFLLAPDWNTGRMAFSSAFFMNMNAGTSALLGAFGGTAAELYEAGFKPEEISGMGFVAGATFGVFASKWMNFVKRRMLTRGDVMAKEARRIAASALAGYFTFGNLMNYAFTGHFMWDNPEGKHLHVDLGATDREGRQLFMGMGKPMAEAFEVAGITHQEKNGFPVFPALFRKMSIPWRTGIQVLTNQSGFGPIYQPEDGPLDKGLAVAAFTIKSTTPIFAQGPTRLAEEALFSEMGAGPVEIARTGLRFGGFSTSGLRSTVSPEAIASRFSALSPPLPVR
jgi:hypothetical protein